MSVSESLVHQVKLGTLVVVVLVVVGNVFLKRENEWRRGGERTVMLEINRERNRFLKMK